MIKIHLTEFYANNENLVKADIINNLQAGITKGGVVCVHFDTVEMYLNVIANCTYYCADFSGQSIKITPRIYDPETNTYLEQDEFPGAYEQYLNHPDYFRLELVVDHETMCSEYFTSRVLALKHEYFVSFVPDEVIMNYDCLREVEIEDYEE